MTGRSLSIALIVSLVFNVFLLGGVGGAAYRWLKPSENPAVTRAVPPPRGLRFAAQGLSPERRRQFQMQLRRTRRDLAPLVAQARQGRVDVAAALANPDFDTAALEAALARTRQADSAVRAHTETAVVEFAATLDPSERAILMEGLQQRGAFRIPPPPPSPQSQPSPPPQKKSE
jgi:uncharacterized membrane protein